MCFIIAFISGFIAAFVVCILWFAFGMISRRDANSDYELEEMTGVVNVRRNNQNNAPIDPNHTERTHEEFND
jgi:hypothetical protein